MSAFFFKTNIFLLVVHPHNTSAIQAATGWLLFYNYTLDTMVENIE